VNTPTLAPPAVDSVLQPLESSPSRTEPEALGLRHATSKTSAWSRLAGLPLYERSTLIVAFVSMILAAVAVILTAVTIILTALQVLIGLQQIRESRERSVSPEEIDRINHRLDQLTTTTRPTPPSITSGWRTDRVSILRTGHTVFVVR
jgi:hypothetical protein